MSRAIDAVADGHYATANRPLLSLEDTLAQLTYVAQGSSPREALEAAIAWRDEITPLLLAEIAQAPVDVEARITGEPDGKAYYLHTLAFFLLGLFRTPRAFPLMLDYFASDSDLADELSGEALSGYLPAMLVRCYDGSGKGQLRLMIETAAFAPIFRHDCLQAYHGLALAGHIDKAEVVAFVGDLLDAIPADATYDRWYPWLAMAAAELQATELRDRIEALFDRSLTKEPEKPRYFTIVDKEDIGSIYRRPSESFHNEILANRLFDNFVDRICRWYWFQKPRETKYRDPASLAYDAFQLGQPHVRGQAKVGRNDTCPCGSGKKYKKCCLN